MLRFCPRKSKAYAAEWHKISIYVHFLFAPCGRLVRLRRLPTLLFAAFLSVKGASDAGSVKRNAAAPVADMSITTESTANSREPGRLPHPPLPPAAHDIQAADMAFSTAGAPSPSFPSVSGQPTLSDTSAPAAAAASSGTLFCDGPGEIFEEVCEPIAAGDDEEKEESIENLLGSLVRALNTTQGRADFGRFVAESSDN